MQVKVMQVFYDENCLPYKDSARTIHYPIVGGAFLGASQTTEIRFYIDRIGSNADTWVVNGKLPNGKVGHQVLLNRGYDDEIHENYFVFTLSAFFTQYKGDVYLSLAGYSGDLDYEESGGIYTIQGTPVIQTTGSIKLTIQYSTALVDNQEQDVSFDDFFAILSTKLNIENGIVVLNDTLQDIDDYEEGQLFFVKDKATMGFYTKNAMGSLARTYQFIGLIYRNGVISNGTILSSAEMKEVEKQFCVMWYNPENALYIKTSDGSGYATFTKKTGVSIYSNYVRITIESIVVNCNSGADYGKASLYGQNSDVPTKTYTDSELAKRVQQITYSSISLSDVVENYNGSVIARISDSDVRIFLIGVTYSTSTSKYYYKVQDLCSQSLYFGESETNIYLSALLYSGIYVEDEYLTKKANQTVSGQLTFLTLPQSDVEPTNGRDLVTLLKAQELEQEAKDYTDEKVAELQAKSDVIDVLGNLNELRAYDTTNLGENDIMNVLSDSEHDNASTFYKLRDAESGETYIEPTTPNPHGWVWVFVGEEGPFLTPNDADTKYQTKIISYPLLNIATSSWVQDEITGKWRYEVQVSSDDVSIGQYDKYCLGGNDKNSVNELGECSINIEDIVTNGSITTITLIGNFQPTISLNVSIVIAKVTPSGNSGITFLTTDDLDNEYIVIKNNKLTVSNEIKDLIAYAKSQGWIS